MDGQALAYVWVRRVAQPIPHEIECQHRQNDKQNRGQQPRVEGNCLDVLRFLEQDTPTRYGWTQS